MDSERISCSLLQGRSIKHVDYNSLSQQKYIKMKKEEIKLISKSKDELTSDIIIKDVKYLVQTQREDPKNFIVMTRTYLKGRILSTIKTDYNETIHKSDPQLKIDELMLKQHQRAINSLITEKDEGTVKEEKVEAIETKKIAKKSPSDYLESAKIFLMRKSQKNALAVLSDAVDEYPDDPFLLSYYGCLEAIVNKNHKTGIEICNRAIAILKKRIPFGEEFFYPVFYLNLGRAYHAAGRKKNAIDAFTKGNKLDGENKDLREELQRLGIRKKSVVPFLKRSNPINRYIGMLLHKISK